MLKKQDEPNTPLLVPPRVMKGWLLRPSTVTAPRLACASAGPRCSSWASAHQLSHDLCFCVPCRSAAVPAHAATGPRATPRCWPAAACRLLLLARPHRVTVVQCADTACGCGQAQAGWSRGGRPTGGPAEAGG
jgi:hypothetical protein